jgi:hypothetical protein
MEVEQPLPHRLRMALQPVGDRGRAPSVPALHNHLGAADPVPGRMATPGKFPNRALFLGI